MTLPRSFNPVFANPPYYDDYDPSKKYLKILFKPGYAVQSRELEQLQSIIQDQIERFGGSIYKNGTKVTGSNVALQPVLFLRVYPTYTDPVSGVTYTVNATDWVGHLITTVSSATPTTYKVARGKVIAVDTSTSDQDPYVVIFYTETITAPAGQDFPTDGNAVAPFNLLTLTDWTDPFNPVPLAQVKNAAEVPTNAAFTVSGQSQVFTITAGVYFINGYFCLVDAQTVAIQQNLAVSDVNYGRRIYDNQTFGAQPFDGIAARIGLNVDWSIVTSVTAPDLFDPASGFSNSNAPGADRYAISLDLVQLPFTAAASDTLVSQVNGSDFIELARVSNGILVSSNSYTVYSDLETTLASRTYDQAGSYTVNTFGIDIEEHLQTGTNGGIYPSDGSVGGIVGDATKLAVGLTPGKFLGMNSKLLRLSMYQSTKRERHKI